MATNDLSSLLSPIRERYTRTRAPITGNSVTTLFASAADVPRLLKAVDAALAYHRPFDHQERVGTSRRCRTCAGLPVWPCAQYKAITAALSGTQPGEDENHDR